jgi:hypothetical protein
LEPLGDDRVSHPILLDAVNGTALRAAAARELSYE